MNTQAAYAQQLDAKIATLHELFAGLDAPEPEVFRSAYHHYRQRAEFRFWHAGADGFYAMFDPATPREPVRVDSFPAASQRVDALMLSLRRAVLDSPELKSGLFQVEFLDTLAGEALLTLIYHRRLDVAWEAAAGVLARCLDVRIVGRSRRQRITIGDDFVGPNACSSTGASSCCANPRVASHNRTPRSTGRCSRGRGLRARKAMAGWSSSIAASATSRLRSRNT